MKTVEGDIEFGEKFKSGVHFVTGIDHGIFTGMPGMYACAGTKWVAAIGAEGVPVADGKSQVLLHGFARNDAVWIVGLEAQRIIGFRAFIGNLANTGEVCPVPGKY